MKGRAGAHGERFAFGFEGARFQKNQRERASVYRDAEERLRVRPGAPNDYQGLLCLAQEIRQRRWELGDFEVVIARRHQTLQDAVTEWLIGGSKNGTHGTTVGATRRFRKALAHGLPPRRHVLVGYPAVRGRSPIWTVTVSGLPPRSTSRVMF